MKSVFLFFLLFLLVPYHSVHAQGYAPQDDSTSLQGQYQFLLKRSKTQLTYKLVNPYRLSVLWKNATDSLAAERKKIRELKSTTAKQSSRLDSQATNLGLQQKTIEDSQNKVDEITLLGYPVRKSIYNSVMWGLVILLAIGFTFLFINSARYRKEARYRIQLYEEISGEYQAYKVKSNEKEKKLARELQDERNKLDELKKR